MLFRESDVVRICMASGRVTHGQYAYPYSTADVARILRCQPKNLHRYIGRGEAFGRERRYSHDLVLCALTARGSLDAHGIAFLLGCNPWQAWVVENMLSIAHRSVRRIARDGTYVWPMRLMQQVGIYPLDESKFRDFMRNRVADYLAAASKEPRHYRSSMESRCPVGTA
ncbi:MAG: hypothetical protein K2Z80_22415 [Xanthobacteraceae bacterium]|jgi:hypothetical protein|nr:hypothetical protein [Xanthobacteraceae bacterium]